MQDFFQEPTLLGPERTLQCILNVPHPAVGTSHHGPPTLQTSLHDKHTKTSANRPPWCAPSAPALEAAWHTRSHQHHYRARTQRMLRKIACAHKIWMQHNDLRTEGQTCQHMTEGQEWLTTSCAQMDGPASSYSDLLIHCAAQQHIRIRFLLCHVTQRIDWMRHGRMQDKARAVTV